MYLTIIEKNTCTTSTQAKFEQIAHDLLLISVDCDVNTEVRVCSYWRVLGSGENPPLEVGVDPDQCTVKNITLFADMACFEEFSFTPQHSSGGSILVDPSIFVRKNDYVDAVGEYFVWLDGGKFLCKFGRECEPVESIINGTLEFFLNEKSKLIGFAINDIGKDAKEIIALALKEKHGDASSSMFFS